MSLDPKTALTQIQTALSQIQTIAADGLNYVPPPPPPPPIPPLDTLNWWVPKAGKSTRSTFVRLLPDGRVAVYYLKTPSGWPMDINVADDNGVYFRVTENDDPSGIGWPGGPLSNPQAYRLYLNGTFKISPRYYDPSKGRILVVDSIVTGERHTTCSTFTTTNLGPARSYISLVPQMVLGGNLGIQDVLVCEYYYTKLAGTPEGFKTSEHFILTANSGWVGWELRQWDGSKYALSKSSIHNLYIPDTTQVPVLPCNITL